MQLAEIIQHTNYKDHIRHTAEPKQSLIRRTKSCPDWKSIIWFESANSFSRFSDMKYYWSTAVRESYFQ